MLALMTTIHTLLLVDNVLRADTLLDDVISSCSRPVESLLRLRVPEPRAPTRLSLRRFSRGKRPNEHHGHVHRL